MPLGCIYIYIHIYIFIYLFIYIYLKYIFNIYIYMQKVFFGIFLRKPEPRDYIFSLHKTAHFLIKHCIFSAREKFFGPGPRGEIFGTDRNLKFEPEVKLLISLLNGALFRLGENFSVRDDGAKFSATRRPTLSNY